jgi:hypothetical protein
MGVDQVPGWPSTLTSTAPRSSRSASMLTVTGIRRPTMYRPS